MRLLYVALSIATLLSATDVGAEEKKDDPPPYATPSVSGEPWKPLDFSSSTQAPSTTPLYVPPLAINARATGPVSVRIVPYQHLQDRLYEPRGSYDEGLQMVIEYKPYPQSAFARIGLKVWDDVWDGKRIREEVRGGARAPLLRTPNEKSGKLEFVFPLCYGRMKC